MGITDFVGGFFGKKEKDKTEETKKEPETESKYSERECALCGGLEADKKWAGQYWHKKCMRSSKKAARKMV
ncbi:MAG: hypothetical protein ABIA76_02755 [Candidatus Diapherotrites archaeon]